MYFGNLNDPLGAPMETLITTHKVTHLIDPHPHIWGWEVAVYLFLGGITGGILILSALFLLMGKDGAHPTIAYKLPLFGPILLILGMVCLFLDLEYKRHVWRFYTAFHPTSPMSWRLWILIFVYPANLALIFATLNKGYPRLSQMMSRILGSKRWENWSHQAWNSIATIAKFNLGLGLALGMYTGILLSALSPRPFWNSPILGPLFLASGISTALVLALLLTREGGERNTYMRWDGWAIAAEILFFFLLILFWLAPPQIYQQVGHLVLGGDLTVEFWIFILCLGLILPLFLETMEMYGKQVPSSVAPLLILGGGLQFRYGVLQGGQLVGWIPYGVRR